MSKKRRKAPAVAADERVPELLFGGWYEGDNHKPGRGWYVFCTCRHVGLGQILPASAWREWRKHRRYCPDATKGRAQ